MAAILSLLPCVLSMSSFSPSGTNAQPGRCPHYDQWAGHLPRTDQHGGTRANSCKYRDVYNIRWLNRSNSEIPQCTCSIQQCTIQNRNVHISVLNGALWGMGQVHCGICEIGLLFWRKIICQALATPSARLSWQPENACELQCILPQVARKQTWK